MVRVTTALLEWAVSSRPLEPGESGDQHMVRHLPSGALLGVVDGLGHGPAAAPAAHEAIRILAEAEAEAPLAALRRCHEGLRATRGAVLALAWLDSSHGRMTWIGIGTVQGVLWRSGAPEILVPRGGVLGRRLPPLHASVLEVAPGDLLVLATDGVHPGFAQQVPDRSEPQEIADSILARHRTGSDDALVLVARYRSPEA
jgi:serine phosphatase RsbU (regulator of sigma subunit)